MQYFKRHAIFTRKLNCQIEIDKMEWMEYKIVWSDLLFEPLRVKS